MFTNTKVMAFYLPQYHETEYNNKWWGEGFTDWTSVKNASALYRGHRQPREPLGGRYYDLSDPEAETIRWQANIARKYGVDGFVIYHYWFVGKKYLNRPAEILLEHKDIDIEYSFSWDSGTWIRNWYINKNEKEVLVQQDYGDEAMWSQHFYDLLPFFKDSRYIKIDNKPVFHIYKANIIPCLEPMKKLWDELSKKEGYDGIHLIVGDNDNRKKLSEVVDGFYNYQPVYSYHKGSKKIQVLIHYWIAQFKNIINKVFNTKLLVDKRDAKMMYRLIAQQDKYDVGKTYYGIMPDYDDTPRRNYKGVVLTKNKSHYFADTLKILLEKSICRQNEFLYITAWNEWSESAYLEPDEDIGYEYLNIIYDVKNDVCERLVD